MLNRLSLTNLTLNLTLEIPVRFNIGNIRKRTTYNAKEMAYL